MFNRVTIVGTGLIGGSLGLALRESGFTGTVVGCDASDVLQQAKACGAVDIMQPDLRAAVAESDLVVLATPVRTTINLLAHVAETAEPNALITDTGSTKAVIAERARQVFGAAAPRRFIPGHPIAGREQGSIANATAGLFRDANWILTPLAQEKSAQLADFESLIQQTGARVLMLTPEEHDLALAFTSHLPQILSNALVEAASASVPQYLPLDKVSGGGWRDMTRLSRSPQNIWSDIFATNSENLQKALDSIQLVLKRMRDEMVGSELKKSVK